MARPASRSCSQSANSATTTARLALMVDVAWPRLVRSLSSARAAGAASWNRGMTGGEIRVFISPRPLSSQNLCEMDGSKTRSLSSERPVYVHQARVIQRNAHLGPTAHQFLQLVGQHRGRRVGVLDRKGAAEAAALLGTVELHEF